VGVARAVVAAPLDGEAGAEWTWGVVAVSEGTLTAGVVTVVVVVFGVVVTLGVVVVTEGTLTLAVVTVRAGRFTVGTVTVIGPTVIGGRVGVFSVNGRAIAGTAARAELPGSTLTAVITPSPRASRVDPARSARRRAASKRPDLGLGDARSWFAPTLV
jgi:hypothetical protein